MLSPILIPVPMQHSMSQGECFPPVYARKCRPLVEAPSDLSISACHPGYLQPDGGLPNGMAHAAGRHSGGGCAALRVSICRPASLQLIYLYNMLCSGLVAV